MKVNFSRNRNVKHTDVTEVKASNDLMYLVRANKSNSLEELWGKNSDCIEKFSFVMKSTLKLLGMNEKWLITLPQFAKFLKCLFKEVRSPTFLLKT